MLSIVYFQWISQRNHFNYKEDKMSLSAQISSAAAYPFESH